MIVLAAAIATFFRIMLQGLIPAGGEAAVGESIVVKAGLLIPAFTIYAFLTFVAIALVFTLIEASLPGPSKLRRGLLFGSAMAVLWAAYLFEPVPLGANTPFPDILAYPLADGGSMLLFGALLGRFVATDKASDARLRIRPLAPLVAIAATFLVLRLFDYLVLDIYSLFADRAADTMLWVVITGSLAGLVYLVVRSGIPSSTPGGRALLFGLVVFGLPLTLFNFFVPLALDVDTVDLAIRTAVDIVAVTLGVFIGEALIARRK
jgi:hypothetical protein